MKFEAILFDLDGTLLPMDMQVFTTGYFKGLVAKLRTEFDLAPDLIVSAVWGGTGAMVKNDGTRTNREVFWEKFGDMTGVRDPRIEELCDDFYGKEFMDARCYVGENPRAAEAVSAARKKAPKVVLATNPIFPMVGQRSRLAWVGLKPEDFDLTTEYANDRYCKPNPKYLLSVCERIHVAPEKCLMIGNDEKEDMYCAGLAGMGGAYLVTDTMIPCAEHPWEGPRGTFADMIEMLNGLEAWSD